MTKIFYTKTEYGSHWLPAVELTAADGQAHRSDFDGPTAVAYGGDLYIFYRSRQSGRVRYLTLDGNDNQSEPKDLSPDKPVPQHNASAAVYNGQLFACYGADVTNQEKSLMLWRMNAQGVWESAGSASGDEGDDFGLPQLVEHKECLWNFHKMGHNLATQRIAYAAIDYPDGTSEPRLRASGIVSTIHPGDQQAWHPVATAVYMNRLYISYSDRNERLILAYTDGRLAPSNNYPWPEHAVYCSAPGSAVGQNSFVYGKSPSLAVYNSLLHITYVNSTRKIYDLTFDGHAFGVPKEVESYNTTVNPVRTAVHAGSLYAFYLAESD